MPAKRAAHTSGFLMMAPIAMFRLPLPLLLLFLVGVAILVIRYMCARPSVRNVWAAMGSASKPDVIRMKDNIPTGVPGVKV